MKSIPTKLMHYIYSKYNRKLEYLNQALGCMRDRLPAPSFKEHSSEVYKYHSIRDYNRWVFRKNCYSLRFQRTYFPNPPNNVDLNFYPLDQVRGYVGFGFFIKRVLNEKSKGEYVTKRFDVYEVSDCKTTISVNKNYEPSLTTTNKAARRLKEFNNLKDAENYCVEEWFRIYFPDGEEYRDKIISNFYNNV